MNFSDKSEQLSEQLSKHRFHSIEHRSGKVCILFALFLSLAILSPACQAQTAPNSDLEIKDLIVRLGDADHLIRTQSEASLLEIGQQAIGPLQAVLNFEDPEIVPDNEIRLRAARLVILIQRESRKRNLAEFLDGKRDDIGLQGWSEFRKLMGSQATARRLFVKLHRSNDSLLNAPKLGKMETENELHKAISRVRLSSSGNAESLTGNLGAVLFVASLKTKWAAGKSAEAPLVSLSDTRRIQKVLVKPHMVTTLNSHFAKTEFKSLISNWLDSLPFQSEDSAKYASAAIAVIDAYQLENKSEFPLQFAVDEKLSANIRATAIEVLSRIADAKMSAQLLRLHSDQTVVGNYLLGRSNKLETKDSNPIETNALMEVQIRDLALATSIILNGSSLEEFGFYPQAFQDNKLVINQAGFFSQQERTKAFSKWEKQNPDKNSKAKETQQQSN